MPCQADNPNRDKNIVVTVLAGVVVFTVIMGGYVTLSLAGQDTDTYLRFITTLVVVIVPSTLSVWQSYKARQSSESAVATTKSIQEDVRNGVLKDKVKEGVKEVLNGDAQVVVYKNGTDVTPALTDALLNEGGNEDVSKPPVPGS